jgi:hypothetical protein
VKRDERREKGIENRDCGLCTEKKKNRPHPLGTTAVLPLHRHNSTVILPLSTLPTPAEPEREKRNRAEQRGKKKQRPRALHRGGEEKTTAPPPGIIVISPPSRCPDHLPLPPDHKRGRTEQTRGRSRESRRQQEEEKKTVTAAAAYTTTPAASAAASVATAPGNFLPSPVIFRLSFICMQNVYVLQQMKIN